MGGRRSRWRSASLAARTAADGVGAREWLEMGGEEKPLAAQTAADGVFARGWLEMVGEKKPLGMSELGCADGCGRHGCKEWLEMDGEKKPLGMGELGCTDGRHGCKGVIGNGWGDEAAGDERAGLRGRLRTAWVQGAHGWTCVREKSRWG